MRFKTLYLSILLDTFTTYRRLKLDWRLDSSGDKGDYMKAIKILAGVLCIPAVALIFCKANDTAGTFIQLAAAAYAVTYLCIRYRGEYE